MKLKKQADDKTEETALTEGAVENLRYVLNKVGLTYLLVFEDGVYSSLCPELGTFSDIGDNEEEALFYLMEACVVFVADDSLAELDEALQRAKNQNWQVKDEWQNYLAHEKITEAMLNDYAKIASPIYNLESP